MTSVPNLLRASFQLYRTHAKLFVGYVSWLLLSYAAIVLVTLIPNEGVRMGLGLAVELADGMLWLFIGVIMIVLTHQLGNGKEIDTNVVPLYALSALGSFAWVGLLQALTVAGGFLLLVIPGLIFLVWFGFAQQALLLDGKRGLDALSASRDLAKGRFFVAALYQLGGPVLVGIAYLVVLSLAYVALSALTHTPIEDIFGDTPPLWADMLGTIGNIFLLPMLSIYGVMAYKEMKTSVPAKTEPANS
ncbi:MAG: hypothetical protein WCO25_02430 [Candidatus Uhrbacteria bacterium]